MKNKCLLLSMGLILFTRFVTAEMAPEVVAPFEEVISRFSKSEWVDHFVPKKEFDNRAEKLLAFLKKNQKDWQSLVDPNISLTDLLSARTNFEKLPYILRVFNTKQGTLIFQVKDQPQIIVKIDNRPTDSFDTKFRSYYDAFEKTKSVQEKFQFFELFLPFEYGRDSKEAKVKFVFSEKVPLFSDAELDNMILMHMMHRNADQDPKLKTKLIGMFKEMLFYICHVDFDDINYRNVPFTVDGRFAPFDTDSFLAQTGVFSFLKEYAGFKLFSSYADVKPIVASSCRALPRETSSLNPFSQAREQQGIFNQNEKILNEMLAFFEKKPLLRGKIKGPENLFHAVATANQGAAAVIDGHVEKNLINPNYRMYTPGRRCHHVKDILAHTNPGIKALMPQKSVEDIDRLIADMLNQGKAAGIVYSHGDKDIFDLKGFVEGFESFICF